jgi:hypothetical protein
VHCKIVCDVLGQHAFSASDALGRTCPVASRETLHGLVFETDLPGVGLACDAAARESNFTIERGNCWAGEASLAAPLTLARCDDGRAVELLVRGVARFVVSPTSVTVQPVSGVRDDVLRLFTRYHALGVCLRLRGDVVLHGAAVRVGDEAHVWVGPSGSGKTSAALAACAAGASFLADEVVVLRLEGARALVQPGVPWPRIDAGAPAELCRLARAAVSAIPEPVLLGRVVLAGASGAPGDRARLAAEILGGYRPELAPTPAELTTRQRVLDAVLALGN